MAPEVVAAIIAGLFGVLIALIKVPFFRKDKSRPASAPEEKQVVNVFNNTEISVKNTLEPSDKHVSKQFIQETSCEVKSDISSLNLPKPRGTFEKKANLGGKSIDDLPIDSPEYIRALSTQAYLLKNKKSIFEIETEIDTSHDTEL